MNCPVCNESEGHAADCPYPDTLEARLDDLNKACRDFGSTLWNEWKRTVREWLK